MKKNRGFTIIELLVAISVILVLAGMLFLGARYMTASTKKNTTRAMLQDLRSMVTERETALGATKVKSEIDTLFATPVKSPLDASLPENKNLDIRSDVAHLGSRYPDSSTTNAASLTQQVMSLLMAIPANKKVFSSLPQQQLLEKPDGATAPLNPALITDGYNNPIVACPSTGLTGVTTNGVVTPIRSPDGKPFFASAGPDGDLSTGDDNVYSFEN